VSRYRGYGADGLLPASALAILLALASAGCQPGEGSPASGGISSSPAARTASVPAPAGARTYAAFCGSPPGCPGGGVPAALRRPMHLPHLAAGTRCPISPPARKVDPNEGAALGPGPIYLVSLFSHTAVMPFVQPSRTGLFGGSSWGGQVLKWIGAPSYHGPVLVRGRKLTGRDGLGFGAGKIPLAEMDVPPFGAHMNPGGWQLWAGYARLRSPGCYGLQVDGTTFSEVIIFRACLSSPPTQQTGRCKSA